MKADIDRGLFTTHKYAYALQITLRVVLNSNVSVDEELEVSNLKDALGGPSYVNINLTFRNINDVQNNVKELLERIVKGMKLDFINIWDGYTPKKQTIPCDMLPKRIKKDLESTWKYNLENNRKNNEISAYYTIITRINCDKNGVIK